MSLRVEYPAICSPFWRAPIGRSVFRSNGPLRCGVVESYKLLRDAVPDQWLLVLNRIYAYMSGSASDEASPSSPQADTRMDYHLRLVLVLRPRLQLSGRRDQHHRKAMAPKWRVGVIVVAFPILLRIGVHARPAGAASSRRTAVCSSEHTVPLALRRYRISDAVRTSRDVLDSDILGRAYHTSLNSDYIEPADICLLDLEDDALKAYCWSLKACIITKHLDRPLHVPEVLGQLLASYGEELGHERPLRAAES
ncbi:hypothetical protein ONZ51_g12195 [Trametes cubensis]|uniref:Uncharacterized protein n=1 Tax=Trametes cubensis TaxID=1111947 RepID=A0AAD7X5L8_9APHY|nr:hypothetical protein ONZ51_g12195 [Trametes cubensis]